MKTCSKCGVSKPLDEFHARKASSDGKRFVKAVRAAQEYEQTPEYKASKRKYKQTPEAQGAPARASDAQSEGARRKRNRRPKRRHAVSASTNQTPEGKASKRKYDQTPKSKARMREYQSDARTQGEQSASTIRRPKARRAIAQVGTDGERGLLP